MSEQPPSSQSPGTPARFTDPIVRAAGIAGVVAAVFGVVNGLLVALSSRPVVCLDRPVLEHGQLNLCHDHQRVGQGVALAAAFVILGAMVVLLGVIADSLVARRGGETRRD